MLTRDEERRKHLRNAWKAYGDARVQARGKQSYQLLNWLALGFLLKKQPRQESDRPRAGRHCDDAGTSRENRQPPQIDAFFDRIAVPEDTLLHVALFEGTLHQSRER